MKDGQQASCNTTHFRSGINHMWILKNSKDFLRSADFLKLVLQTFDFSTLYNILPYDKLKSRLKGLIRNLLLISRKYVLDYKSTHFLKQLRKVSVLH